MLLLCDEKIRKAKRNFFTCKEFWEKGFFSSPFSQETKKQIVFFSIPHKGDTEWNGMVMISVRYY